MSDRRTTDFCIYEECDQEAVYCAGHAGEFVADALNKKDAEIDTLRGLIVARRQDINQHIDALDEKDAEIARLQTIIAKFFEGWPEPWADGMDGFEIQDFQDFGAEHGILIGEDRETPCGEHCNCAEYFGDDEIVRCYRMAPEYLERISPPACRSAWVPAKTEDR